MSTIQLAGVAVEVTDEGFLSQASQWTKSVAEGMAKTQGIDGLTKKHWKVIDFARKYYKKQGEPPGMQKILRATKLGLKEMYTLFPKATTTDPCATAAKIAGLPKPGY